MVSYIVRRLLLAALTVLAISVLSFIIIHLPPGDYVTSYISSMSASGTTLVTMPRLQASCALSTGEVKYSSRALALPSIWVRKYVPP